MKIKKMGYPILQNISSQINGYMADLFIFDECNNQLSWALDMMTSLYPDPSYNNHRVKVLFRTERGAFIRPYTGEQWGKCFWVKEINLITEVV